MRVSFLLTFGLFSSISLHAQVTNSYASDKTGMYFFAIDSLLETTKEDKKVERVFIAIDNISGHHQTFPNTISNIPVKEVTEEFDPESLSKNEVYIYDLSLQVFGETISVSFLALCRSANYLSMFGKGMYLFHYQFDNQLNSYKLMSIHEASVNVHFDKQKLKN